ncbi:Carbonic anhydrase 2 (Beta-CA 2) (Carbonate dehydratase 2) (mtCA 2) [Durusdinium trenchii]|uniref:carbonic anhydrase n=1 Tax=Durusdinium trenchii TaxID=1381693 RepID=A0ABP0LZ56_9DINO
MSETSSPKRPIDSVAEVGFMLDVPPDHPMAREGANADGRVRTAGDWQVPPEMALKFLEQGNGRFIRGSPKARVDATMRKELERDGQAPHSAILGCADSRCPLETIFDTLPGDIFVLRNAGNTCTHAEGSMVGSLEFCTGKLGARLILVLGHTKCGAVYGATQAYVEGQRAKNGIESALEGLLEDMSPVATSALKEHMEAVAATAIRVNVFHTIDFLLKYSAPLRERVENGDVEIHGGIYHLDSGKVEFMGESPRQAELLNSSEHIPPSMTLEGGRRAGYGPPARGAHGLRTAADGPMSANEALNMLKEGNERFAVGAPFAKLAGVKMREALVTHGQAPHTAIMGCADSRVPLETVFDALPGDLFVLRNAGNTCTHAEGSMVGSLEFCAGKLGSKLILVLGHTQCGAIAGATKTYLAGKHSGPVKAASALEGLLIGLSGAAQQAEDELGACEPDQLVAHCVRVNVWRSIDFLLKFSAPLRALVRSGNLEIQGGIYHLETGRVEFMGRSPKQAELVASEKTPMPPMLQSLPIRTTRDGPMQPRRALRILKDGNRRFHQGEPLSGNVTGQMRKALAQEGQAPLAAILGCADSRAPLETVFDTMPGDVFVLRNAGNTCTHAEGSVMGSLEFCVGSLDTKLIIVLGHTACGAIKGATKTHFLAKNGQRPQVTRALDALLQSLSAIAAKANDELGHHATEEEVATHAVRLNVFHSIDRLLEYSPLVRSKVEAGEVEIHGGIYDLETGEVRFLGTSPNQDALLKCGSAWCHL